jgi:arylsulfatase A-like enzyme
VKRALVASAALLLGGCGGSRTPPPNVLVLVVDTLRADALGAYGNPVHATPGIDRFAGESVVFERAWAQSTFTPGSYVSYMTSTYVRTHGWDYGPADYPAPGICGWTDLTTLPEALSKHGFDRVALVANHALHPKRGFPRGFERWNGLEVASLESAGALPMERYVLSDDALVERARSEIAAWKPGRRHFLYVHLLSPHLPLDPSPEARARFGLAPSGAIDLPLIERLRERSTPREQDVTRRAYLACVADMDRRVRGILDAVDGSHRDDTVVAFLADHGEEMWEHGDYGHQDGVWEALTHVPLMLRAPGLAPKRVASPVGLLDVPPTLLALLGIGELPPSWQGQDLLGSGRRAGAFSQRFAEVAVTADGRLKTIGSPEASGAWTFFDLSRDPAEQRPLAGDAGAPDLRSLYETWKTRVPRIERDRNAEPVGMCRSLAPSEEEEQRERLRSLGYVR